jgi:hypothetical protein
MRIIKRGFQKSEIVNKPIDLSLPDNDFIPFKQEFFKSFHHEFQIRLKDALIDIDKSVRMAPKLTSFEGDFEKYSRVRYALFYELIDEFGYVLIEVFASNIKISRYSKISFEEIQYIHKYFIHNLDILSYRFLNIVGNAAMQLNAKSHYENYTNQWLSASFQTKVNRLVEKLDIEINKHNLNPQSFIYRMKDQLSFEVIKYGVIGTLGYTMGKLVEFIIKVLYQF